MTDQQDPAGPNGSATASEAGKPRYALDKDQRLDFASTYLLERMVRTGQSYPILLEQLDNPNAMCLKDMLDRLYLQGYTVLDKANNYVPSQQGLDRIQTFRQRYTEYVGFYVVYSRVDLNTGEFAFEQYFDLAPNPDLWQNYLSLPRWEDLRIAVAEYKKLNPVEMVFLGFLFEGKFQLSGEGWEFDLVMGKAWDDLLEIVNSNLSWRQLGYEDVSSESVIEDVITKGANVMFELLKRYEQEPPPDEGSDLATSGGSGGGEVVETTETVEEVETVVIDEPYGYYSPYCYDPFYISPIWAVPLFVAAVILF